jgi:hypothetical protein
VRCYCEICCCCEQTCSILQLVNVVCSVEWLRTKKTSVCVGVCKRNRVNVNILVCKCVWVCVESFVYLYSYCCSLTWWSKSACLKMIVFSLLRKKEKKSQFDFDQQKIERESKQNFKCSSQWIKTKLLYFRHLSLWKNNRKHHVLNFLRNKQANKKKQKHFFVSKPSRVHVMSKH